jgi:hypothetical protein
MLAIVSLPSSAMLTLHTVIPQPDLAPELHATFDRHPAIHTHVVQLTLGPPGRKPTLISTADDTGQLDRTHNPRSCSYDHASRLIEVLGELDCQAGVDIPDDGVFDRVEQAAPRNV